MPIVMCEEELVENAIIQLFDLSNYSDSLSTEAKERYLSKLVDIGCDDCPYTISNTFWSSGPDIDNVIPPVERGDLWNYLVYGKSLYTDSEMKNYKSCQSYQIIIGEGLFFDFKCLKLSNLNNMIETVSELKNTQKNKSKKLRVDTSPISTDAFKMMMEEYMNSGIQSALLTVLPDYSKNFIPLQLKVTLPDPLSKIFSSHLRGKPLSVLLKESEDLFSKYCVSNQQAEAIEMLTRAQSKNMVFLTVNYDTNYQRETIPNCKDFAKTGILPELIGKFYTETRYGKQVNVENELQLPSTSINIQNEEQSVNNDANRNVLMNLDTNISSVDISSSNVISNPSIHISDKNPLRFIMQSSSCSTFYGPCFCSFHRGKKRFGENWTCDDCKQQRKKVLKVRKPLKSVS
uniref:Uncharacterized protein n=1 Tax=Daphnia galeata TaxID=27404 RepID=A0A8J2RNL5_9CRUS|nr:unnamed protein product [Daphnia galeata]